jgi:hypothetical protein
LFVTGEFTSINGILDLDENDITKSKIRSSIDAATISTREPQRDAHLKSADFFHVEKHPALTFNSTSITRTTDAELKVSGDLTICGVTRNVVFDVDGPSTAQKDPCGNNRIGLFSHHADQPERLWSYLEQQPWKLAACWWATRNHQLGRPAHQRALIKEGTERVQFDHTFN